VIDIVPIPCLHDNYAYLVSLRGHEEAWLVDPSEPDAPRSVLRQRTDLRLRGILATHHHDDHVGGIDGLLDEVAAKNGDRPFVAGHQHDRGRIPHQSVFVDAPRERFVAVELARGAAFEGHARVLAMHIPGHTLGAIAWWIRTHENDPGDVFTGDTLFSAGCGRLFEGTPSHMFTSLRALMSLPSETRLWFGHEYTAANLRFASTVEPDNVAVRSYAAALASCTTPTTVARERAVNPFVRASSVDVLAERRAAKDRFRS